MSDLIVSRNTSESTPEGEVFDKFVELYKTEPNIKLHMMDTYFPKEDIMELCRIIEKDIEKSYIQYESSSISVSGSTRSSRILFFNGYAISLFLLDYATMKVETFFNEIYNNFDNFKKLGGISFFAIESKIVNPDLSRFVNNVLKVRERRYDKASHKKFFGVIKSSKNSEYGLRIHYMSVNDTNNDNDNSIYFGKNEHGLDELYNDNFKKVNNSILHGLKNTPSGITLLHGPPGTGKTSYLRWLIMNCEGKEFVYMPPFLANEIGSPGFLGFLMSQSKKNTVFIIEDAENILRTREAGGNEAVQNILNASDGLLGNAINAHFICTFNCNEHEIDSALFRPGRLIEQYEFTTLDAPKARRLWQKIHGHEVSAPSKPMTIAEIFNHGAIKNPKEEKRQSFGFIPQS